MKETDAKIDRLFERARQAPIDTEARMPIGLASRIVSQAFGDDDALCILWLRRSVCVAVTIMIACVFFNLSVFSGTPLTADLAVRKAMAQIVFDR